MSPADIPPFDEHGGLHPAFLAKIDQSRAKTRDEVGRLVKRFREHSEQVHGGDQICAHAMTACSLYMFRDKMEVADLAAGAIARLVDVERTLARYQQAEQDRVDGNA